MKIQRLGLIAGNGRFPFLILEETLRQGISVVVAAIREETFPEIENFARNSKISVHWLGLGQLGELIRLFKQAGVEKAVMAGQVKHTQIFFRKGRATFKEGVILPDLKMVRVFMSLPHKNTESLIGGVIRTLEKVGIELIDSTLLLRSLIPDVGVLTRRRPNNEESKDMEYGRSVAREIARLDLGQTIVVKDQAVVAVEAMEGTDETIRRGARLLGGQRLTVVKASRPDQDMRFDVPAVGLSTLDVMRECNVSALAIDAGKTLILDREKFIQEADRLKATIVAFNPESLGRRGAVGD